MTDYRIQALDSVFVLKEIDETNNEDWYRDDEYPYEGLPELSNSQNTGRYKHGTKQKYLSYSHI